MVLGLNSSPAEQVTAIVGASGRAEDHANETVIDNFYEPLKASQAIGHHGF